MKIDLITGFLGAGKTTFIKHYAKYLTGKGEHICILENDYGAINIDMLLLEEELGELCDTEMVVGGGDWDCHRRRLKTKLIAMAMNGYDRVIMEPSGVFDMDEFFDLLYEEPLDRWYEAGSVIAVVDASIADANAALSDASAYTLISEASHSGLVVLSKLDQLAANVLAGDQSGEESGEMPGEQSVEQTVARVLNTYSKQFSCTRYFAPTRVLAKSFEDLTQTDFERIETIGWMGADMVKLPIATDGSYQNLFYFHIERSEEQMRKLLEKLFTQEDTFGRIIRVKGFMKADVSLDGDSPGWLMLNATRENTQITKSRYGQDVIIVIGENLQEQAIGEAFGETRSVLEYEL